MACRTDYLKVFLMRAWIKYTRTIKKQPFKALLWFAWDLPGFHTIFNKIFPPSNSSKNSSSYKPPPTFGILVFSIYFACLGFATARYERNLDRAEFKYNTLTTQLAAGIPFDKNRVEEVGEIRIPIEPKFEWHNCNFLVSIWESLSGKKDFYYTKHKKLSLSKGTIVPEKINSKHEFLIMMVELWKHNLSGAQLSRANLEKVNLRNANLEDANLSYAILRYTDFTGANLKNANLSKAKFLGTGRCQHTFRLKRIIYAAFFSSPFDACSLTGLSFTIAS